MIKEYVRYLKDNPERHWFRAKLYGWGWVPATWEGWVTVLAYCALVALFSFTIDNDSSPREVFFTFILPVALLTTTLIRICYKKGERPEWKWGRRSEKK